MLFLKISQNSQENNCARVSFLVKLQAKHTQTIRRQFADELFKCFWPGTLLKKKLWHRCFSVNFVKFLRTSFFIEHLWWLLLSLTILGKSSILDFCEGSEYVSADCLANIPLLSVVLELAP